MTGRKVRIFGNRVTYLLHQSSMTAVKKLQRGDDQVDVRHVWAVHDSDGRGERTNCCAMHISTGRAERTGIRCVLHQGRLSGH
jgi:hypothetical protein